MIHCVYITDVNGLPELMLLHIRVMIKFLPGSSTLILLGTISHGIVMTRGNHSLNIAQMVGLYSKVPAETGQGGAAAQTGALNNWVDQ